ncbi:PTS beta-glucoside transporter subunit IIBCA [Pseudoflavonifractor phocaeensis]|uniref:PTS beta-glucoside transporter subunit IIBCA n=1 Tax=Pseudoflavonifractor phocaeensis TaxID=1870988 RepID=UPI00195D5B4D|nr:PTS beta-glucoside transporter subunit IIBCA [Pseudoflavonifractor phocaeensis]MBM6869054.1 PTS glucose transporter subunit IIA [Pseudoflavonifractor phocaeensis]
MDYRKCAQDIYDKLGGRENLVSAAHCATRLRLVTVDNSKIDLKGLEDTEGVKGVFQSNGQLQLIIGTGTVNKVYDEFLSISGMTAATKDEVKAAAAAKQNILQRMVKALGDVFVPILPAIVASGLLMGILEGLSNAIPGLTESGTYTIFHMFSNAAFVFLPILVAVSAARVFGGNIFLGAVMGMIMIHSDLVNAWNVASMTAAGQTIPTADVWFGLFDIQLTGYQGHVIPVIIAVWLMCQIEKWLHKHVPEMIDLFVTPLTTVCVTGYLTLTIFGPIFSTLETWVLNGVQVLITIPFGIGAALMGIVYPLTVVCGIHHMYNVIEAGMLSSGLNTWMPIASAANFAQGAACLAVALKTRNRKFKSLALPSALSGFLGITEPAIFGVNLRFVTPLIAGMVGAAAGSVVAYIFGIGATAYGVTGLFGFLTTTGYTVPYLIELVVTFVVAFAVCWVLYREKEEETEKEPKEAQPEQPAVTCVPGVVYAPLSGTVIPMEEIPDPTFAAGVLGMGCGIVPDGSEVVAPFDGTISTAAGTGHAIGISSPDGMELLIHVGIDTVSLDGKGFQLLCAEGDTVKAGQTLMRFDPDVITKAGLSTTTAVMVTNAEDYETVQLVKTGAVRPLEQLLEAKVQCPV